MKKLKTLALIPLTMSSFTHLKYDKITPNKLTFDKNKMTIKVNKSASPLFHLFNAPKKISKISIKGELKNLPSERFSTLIKADDYPLRVGLISEGELTLGFFQKMMAVDWLKHLFERAQSTKATGVGDVHFFSLSDEKNLNKTIKKDYFSIQFKTTFIAKTSEDKFEFTLPADKNKKYLGIWINADGDGSKSEYQTIIESIDIQ